MIYRRPAVKRGSSTSYGGRGAQLENLLNFTNELYERHEIALVQKIPTPITPISMQGNMISKAFFAEKSTVDYIGTYRGRALCFDAKECHEDTFPLKNVHEHQIRYMQMFEKCGGLSFLIIYYTKYEKFYFMPFQELNIFIERMKDGGRKSIAFSELDESHFFVTESEPVPYLQTIDRLTAEGDKYLCQQHMK